MNLATFLNSLPGKLILRHHESESDALRFLGAGGHVGTSGILCSFEFGVVHVQLTVKFESSSGDSSTASFSTFVDTAKVSFLWTWCVSILLIAAAAAQINERYEGEKLGLETGKKFIQIDGQWGRFVGVFFFIWNLIYRSAGRKNCCVGWPLLVRLYYFPNCRGGVRSGVLWSDFILSCLDENVINQPKRLLLLHSTFN